MLSDKTSQTKLTHMRHLMGEVEKDVNRIKYSKKHNQVLKKLHTTDGLRLANPDAFAEMQKIDPQGKLWKGSDYEDIFGNGFIILLHVFPIV